MANGARTVYDEYYDRVRKMVPPERRLEYRLGDGWGPLCDFLGVEVPEDTPFPRCNDSMEQFEMIKSNLFKTLPLVLWVVIPYLVGGAVVLAGVLALRYWK